MNIIKSLEKLIINYNDAKCPGGYCCNYKFVIENDLLYLLTLLVERLEKRLYIKYLYKCIDFNLIINGGNNYHALGLAIDVDTIQTKIEPLSLAQLSWDVGFNAIGVYGTNEKSGYKNKKGMVHLGIEPIKRYWGDWKPSLL